MSRIDQIPLSSSFSFVSTTHHSAPFLVDIHPVQAWLPWNKETLPFLTTDYAELSGDWQPQNDFIIINAPGSDQVDILELAECKLGEEILILGHPKKAKGPMSVVYQRKIVEISADDQNTLMYRND